MEEYTHGRSMHHLFLRSGLPLVQILIVRMGGLTACFSRASDRVSLSARLRRSSVRLRLEKRRTKTKGKSNTETFFHKSIKVAVESGVRFD